MIFVRLLIIYLTFILLAFRSASGQQYSTYIGVEVGVSATHSFWEGTKPDRYDFRLHNISQASPNFKIDMRKKFGKRLWVSLGAKAQPVSWKKFIYYYDTRYRRTTYTSTTGVWQFPLIFSTQVKEIIVMHQYTGRLSLELGIMPSFRNPDLDLNLGTLAFDHNNDSTRVGSKPRYDNGYLVNYLAITGLSFAIELPNEKLLSLRTNVAIGTRTAFREFMDYSKGYVIRSNGSYMQLTIGYHLPVKPKEK